MLWFAYPVSIGIIRHRLVQRVACVAIDGAALATAVAKGYCTISGSVASFIVSPADIIGSASATVCMDFRTADGYVWNSRRNSRCGEATTYSRSVSAIGCCHPISMDGGVLNRDVSARSIAYAPNSCGCNTCAIIDASISIDGHVTDTDVSTIPSITTTYRCESSDTTAAISSCYGQFIFPAASCDGDSALVTNVNACAVVGLYCVISTYHMDGRIAAVINVDGSQPV